ncbi:MAG: NDP-hexose 3,4-dehydratase [Candidatus Kaiserbacteria bacterium GW2011_GWC2_52_8b]|uniref:NDP-hexose 3,4-dehydratase n=1 Tax=Candidatus Kaiserbacteria bacterium GW2011_GWC2_52_8b TaxID=1618676 RepID=A0A0G2AEC8_9BACT|nr:MAG: NDP-hexose 3,4-dehydratase [Candidatus Kaiserbacteria bacterium GW2011_GWC2_52_8b]
MSARSKKTMRVPYALSVHGKEEIDAVVRKEFENKIAALFGKKYGCMVNSGSSANLLAFELLNLPKGSEVITPLLTFSTVVAPIVQKGLVPVFCDVDPRTFQIDIDQLEKAITKKTRALMIPSLICRDFQRSPRNTSCISSKIRVTPSAARSMVNRRARIVTSPSQVFTVRTSSTALAVVA